MSSDAPACVALRNQVPADWDVPALASVTDFQEGPGILAKDFRDSGVPLLRLRNIETPTVQLGGCNFLDPEHVAKRWRHFGLAEGDFLISTSASLGRVSVVGPDAVGAIPYTGIIRFRSASPKLHHKYLRAFLSSSAFIQQAEQMATGSVIRHFGPSHLRQMAIGRRQLSWPPGDNYPGRWRRGEFLDGLSVLAGFSLVSFFNGCLASEARQAGGIGRGAVVKPRTPPGAVHRLVLWAGGLSTAGAGLFRWSQ